jgi:hypothetical protein
MVLGIRTGLGAAGRRRPVPATLVMGVLALISTRRPCR